MGSTAGSQFNVDQGSKRFLEKQTDTLPRKRVIDRFIKYPYPSNIITNYKKDYDK